MVKIQCDYVSMREKVIHKLYKLVIQIIFLMYLLQVGGITLCNFESAT
jgi:hypothetical protein